MQCNGTPTYEGYSKLNSRCLLFFDTKAAEVRVADALRKLDVAVYDYAG
jgi:hypothetical protein